MTEDYYSPEYDEGEEIETCCEGFNPCEFGECCDCIHRFGIEHCEFMCPFKGPPLPCFSRDCCDSDEEYEEIKKLYEKERCT